MKVYEYGHIKPMYAFCSGCGAILEFVRQDAKMSNMCLAKGPQNNGKDYVITCPVCGRAVYEQSWKATAEEC